MSLQIKKPLSAWAVGTDMYRNGPDRTGWSEPEASRVMQKQTGGDGEQEEGLLTSRMSNLSGSGIRSGWRRADLPGGIRSGFTLIPAVLCWHGRFGSWGQDPGMMSPCSAGQDQIWTWRRKWEDDALLTASAWKQTTQSVLDRLVLDLSSCTSPPVARQHGMDDLSWLIWSKLNRKHVRLKH